MIQRTSAVVALATLAACASAHPTAALLRVPGYAAPEPAEPCLTAEAPACPVCPASPPAEPRLRLAPLPPEPDADRHPAGCDAHFWECLTPRDAALQTAWRDAVRSWAKDAEARCGHGR